jgi:hypothetical protein
VVQIHLGPPTPLKEELHRIVIRIGNGAVAQLGERRLCTPEVASSILVSSTTLFFDRVETPGGG